MLKNTNVTLEKIRSICFKQNVLSIVSRIPKGATMTSHEVARVAGSPKAYRAVGNILNKNYDPAIPCHRVVRSDGTLGGYNRGIAQKRKLLQDEGASSLI
ncbi:MAG: MGMT family protein [Patescibacteria group bacterium]